MVPVGEWSPTRPLVKPAATSALDSTPADPAGAEALSTSTTAWAAGAGPAGAVDFPFPAGAGSWPNSACTVLRTWFRLT